MTMSPVLFATAAVMTFAIFLAELHIRDHRACARQMRVSMIAITAVFASCSTLSIMDVDCRPVSIIAISIWLVLCILSSGVERGPLFATLAAASTAPSIICVLVGVSDHISEMLLLLPIWFIMERFTALYFVTDRYWDRRRYITLSNSMIPLALSCIIGTVLGDYEIFMAGLMVTIVLFYASMISDRIVLDSTGVYGPDTMWRRIVKALNAGKRLNVAMCQVGGNKEVNDDYGHREGGRVFQAFADCLKEETAGTGMIVGRYWASKYLIIQIDGDIEELNDVCMRVKDGCLRIADGHPYTLKPCCALDEITDPTESLDTLVVHIEREYLYDYLHVD